FLATSIDVERLFSRGCLIITHTRSHLSAQTTRALLCLGAWSLHHENEEEMIYLYMALPIIKSMYLTSE
ncbi:hypothetical protein PAXINDRAFT_76130, partial [Paxillus involutus ATCC 200175]